MGPEEIVKGIYIVGSSDISDPKDCSVYLIDLGELILIDTGAGTGTETVIGNIISLGLDPKRITTVILTHCHIDHVGGAHVFKGRYGSRIVMHELDAAAVERGDNRMTAAYWYGVDFAPLDVDVKLAGKENRLSFPGNEIVCLHTPGHTPGSISVYVDTGGKRVLFGQDIHGPFLAEFGANISHWQKSMEMLLSLKADILCEGHFGTYRPNERVTEYIERYLDEYGE
ncbi:MAG: Metallo-beta-lactamase L1 precursor [Syntrophorhabdus sp. PtaU1.Bin058]|nr:MAG: Metallo-beta-lactamase L1 precursor [Syntrophorhabdus sp. PtaU1.Bin058]